MKGERKRKLTRKRGVGAMPRICHAKVLKVGVYAHTHIRTRGHAQKHTVCLHTCTAVANPVRAGGLLGAHIKRRRFGCGCGCAKVEVCSRRCWCFWQRSWWLCWRCGRLLCCSDERDIGTQKSLRPLGELTHQRYPRACHPTTTITLPLPLCCLPVLLVIDNNRSKLMSEADYLVDGLGVANHRQSVLASHLLWVAGVTRVVRLG